MAHHRFFIGGPLRPEPETGDEIVVPLDVAQLHHAARVARLREGERILVADPTGVWHLDVTSIGEDLLSATVQGREERRDEPEVTLFAGLTKGHKMDLTVEKCVEIGVSRIVPVVCERTVVHLTDEKALERAERWQRVASAAAAQSQRQFVPTVETPLPLSEVAALIGEHDTFIVAWEGPEEIAVGDALSPVQADASVAIMVGPEGGLTEDEAAQLEDGGATIVGLGRNVLRSETAGIVLAALTVYEMGGLGGRSRG